ncbi:unnamed protein product, partial [Symbiodinium necroappetens]
EADLDERQSLLQRRRAALQQREERIQVLTSELAEAHETEAESRRTSAEKEKRLEEIWEQIYQRQAVLEDLRTRAAGSRARGAAAARDAV